MEMEYKVLIETLFEELDEVVYISDIESYELVYLNRRGRELFGYSGSDDYKGKLCYKVLQGLNNKCEFCNNKELKECSYKTWIYKNPILDREYIIKDTLIKLGEKDYKLEIAIDKSINSIKDDSPYYSHRGSMIVDCIRDIFSSSKAEDSLNELMRHMCGKFGADRAYIFEVDKERLYNTYEYCKDGVVGQKEVLQDIDIRSIDWWLEEFRVGNLVYISNLEDIKDSQPYTYSILKPQGIGSLVVGPIMSDKDKIVGFIGLDNPDIKYKHLVSSFLKVIGYFTLTLLKRRDLYNKLVDLSYRDNLTGAYNRNALYENYKNIKDTSVGVIYGDISGLKLVNDNIGHEAGDKLIKDSYKLMEKYLGDSIYRVGGDEFVSIQDGISEERLKDVVVKLKDVISRSDFHIAIGYAWVSGDGIKLDDIIKQADEGMYKDKKEYYCNSSLGTMRDRRAHDMNVGIQVSDENLERYIKNNNIDLGLIFKSLTMLSNSSYIYFGDLINNSFYISDNMRERFGFNGNIVYGLIDLWESRIATMEYKRVYREDIKRLLSGESKEHDLKYQVIDRDGNIIWVRCCGIVKWENGVPVFFSGSVSVQDDTFIIDPITNLPREHSALNRIKEIQDGIDDGVIITFGLNHFSNINETKGRYKGNELLKLISSRINQRYSGRVYLYRLEGIRFMCIYKCSEGLELENIIDEIRNIIDISYKEYDISVMNNSAFGVIRGVKLLGEPQSLLDNALVLVSNAKNMVNLKYVEYDSVYIKKLKQEANIELQLNKDVVDGMANFRVVIQPVVASIDSKVIGGEVLLRWKYNSENVSPAVFIPMLERGKNIGIVGKWVFEQTVKACRQILSYNKDFYLTFNVSYNQIKDNEFLEYIKMVLKRYNIDGRHLVAELTETHFDECPESLSYFVRECNKLGIRIALDDFGNGYSSLGLLLKYPASIVKLDRSLLMEMSESEDKKNFISSIVYACHKFGKKVCVEGVETDEQSDIVKESDCDMVQGYYHYKPMELVDIYKLVSEW